MSKRTYFSRYQFLIARVRRGDYPSFTQLQTYIKQHENIAFSIRTIYRDIDEIKQIFGVHILYSHQHKGYYIEENNLHNQYAQKMLEAFDVFNAFNMAEDMSQYIQAEQRKAQGTENLYLLLHAIKNRLQINFEYQKFYDKEATKRYIDPYLLKEFRNRWYVIGKDSFDERVKTFGLDRISEIEILHTKFEIDKLYRGKNSFEYCFGIIQGEHKKPEKIALSFTPFQGKYVKTLPLHHSQKVLVDNDQELRISLEVYPTHDLKMEILSYGTEVKIIAPQAFVKDITQTLVQSLRQYKNEP